jgi:hypothetical protein
MNLLMLSIVRQGAMVHIHSETHVLAFHWPFTVIHHGFSFQMAVCVGLRSNCPPHNVVHKKFRLSFVLWFFIFSSGLSVTLSDWTIHMSLVVDWITTAFCCMCIMCICPDHCFQCEKWCAVQWSLLQYHFSWYSKCDFYVWHWVFIFFVLPVMYIVVFLQLHCNSVINSTVLISCRQCPSHRHWMHAEHAPYGLHSFWNTCPCLWLTAPC